MSDAAVQPTRRATRRAAPVIALVVATAILAYFVRDIDWRRTLDTLSTARPEWVLVAIAMNCSGLLIWTSLWRTLLPSAERVSFGGMFEIVAITSAIMNTVPFGVGHATSVVLLVRRGGEPMRFKLTIGERPET